MPGAVFLDRDGVLCENSPTYVKSWKEFRWLPMALEGLRILADVGLPVIMVTNQSAVNRGLATLRDVADTHARMQADVLEACGRLDVIYVCPHRPDEACTCRKPKHGLFRRAAEEWAVELRDSYLVGDSHADLEAGWSLGLQVILVRTGLGRETEAGLQETSFHLVIAQNLYEAAQWIRRREVDGVSQTAGQASLGRIP